ncbi:hypothetical protein [Vannielia litorea]|uniref:hypothetical protein n=1 Tax=Vannielia litorea TaxID=1217970 RepID=UPI001BCFBA28|nr:hypothetical protein [Vannielia litorea]
MTRYIKLPSLSVPPDKHAPSPPRSDDADKAERKTDEAEKPAPAAKRKARIL